MPFTKLVCTFEPAGSTLRLAGSVDETSVATLRDAIERYSEHFTHDLHVDLSEVDFLPSVGLGVLASAMRRADEHGHSIELAASHGSIVHRVLTITGMPHTTS